MIGRLIFVFIYMLLCLGYEAPGCNLPVYRYAMQYWRQNTYTIRCFHKGFLRESDQKLVQYLEEHSLNGQYSFNFILETVDLSQNGLENLFPSDLPQNDWPYLVIYYPDEIERTSVWHGRLDDTIREHLADSPIRSEIAARLAAGETAVWIFVESENRKMDSEKLLLLQEELQKLENGLKFPDQTQTLNFTSDKNPEEEADLRIKFSSLVLSRLNPKEEILLSLLLHSESDLGKYVSVPMVFPVYGRGRILYALVGDGITPENIRKTAEYFVAPCTCILKDANTGTDLLMTTDWSGGTGNLGSVSMNQQSLSGLREYIPDLQAPQTPESEEDVSRDIHPVSLPHKKIRFRIIVSMAVIPVVVLFFALIIIHKRKRT